MDFALMPPELTSSLMYSGVGSGPMMAAAGAWNSLAAELSTTAAACESVISTLAGDQWLGPSSASMAAATQPYLTWMNATAAAAEQTAAQAMASAAAFEAAFAAIVPPPVIAANRTLLSTLVATNFLGINTPAIMATEAQYAEMWVQDAVTMYGYAGASASAGKLSTLTPAPTATNPAGAATQAAAVSASGGNSMQSALSSVIPSLSTAVSSLANPLTSGTGPIHTILNGIDSFIGIPFVFNGIQQVGVTAAWFVGNTIPTAVALGHTVANAPVAALASDVEGAGAGLAGGSVLASALGPTGAAGSAGLAGFAGGAPVLAGLGEAGAVGGMSVPAGWSAAAPAGAATLAGSGWTAAAEESTPVTTVPAGMPAMASAGRGAGGFGGPRYGFKPTVMPKQVIV